MFKKLFFVVLFSPFFTQSVMKLTSSAFAHNSQIPAKYTCEEFNISPGLQWINPPKDAKSFALIVDDPDASQKNWVHWIVFNIPTGTYVLEENFNKLNQNNTFVTGSTDFDGAQTWGGPCPPSGNHRYHFTLYALNTMLDLPSGATKEQLLKAMEGHILDQATLIGMYGKKEEENKEKKEENKDKKETDKKSETAKDQEKGSEDKEQSNKDKEVSDKDKEAADKDKEESKKDTETVNKDQATKEADQNKNKESENKNKA